MIFVAGHVLKLAPKDALQGLKELFEENVGLVEPNLLATLNASVRLISDEVCTNDFMLDGSLMIGIEGRDGEERLACVSVLFTSTHSRSTFYLHLENYPSDIT